MADSGLAAATYRVSMNPTFNGSAKVAAPKLVLRGNCALIGQILHFMSSDEFALYAHHRAGAGPVRGGVVP